MKRNVFVLFVTLLLTLNTLLVIVPQDNIVKADTTPPIPEIDTGLIYNVTAYLCDIINSEYDPDELAKGRAFGTKGEHKAADYLAYKMTDLDLYDPTTTTYPAKSYREKMESIDSYYLGGDLTAKLETLYQNLSINHSSTTTDLVDFYIHPRWNSTLFTEDYDKLTNNFSHTELRIKKRPKTPWLDYSICDLINDTLNDLEDDEIWKNLTLNDFDAFFNAVCKKIESTYNFTFSDIVENPEKAKDLPWYNDTYWNETGDFVFIDEDPFFNPNTYFPPVINITNELIPFEGLLKHMVNGGFGTELFNRG